MSAVMAEWEVSTFDEEVERDIRAYYALIWHAEFGLNDDDALSAGHLASEAYKGNTDWSEDYCLDRALDIAFDVKATYKEI